MSTKEKRTVEIYDDDDEEEDFAGYVTPRVRNADVRSVGSSGPSQRTHDSWARDEMNAQVNLTVSPMSAPSRNFASTQRNRNIRTATTPPRTLPSSTFRTTGGRNVDEFSLPSELDPVQQQQEKNGNKKSSFKSWLTAGILDSLNVVAGVTLSTTGHLMAPPLHMTKAVLLPGLLALFIDTLDNMTPPRVQDWFRVLSTSVYHLMSVLSETDPGKRFSQQFFVVLRDIVQAISAPETRQVLVDGMATSVKLAEALNTPETLELLEQMAILGCRVVDVAASGKTKQLLQDSKDLTWKGIEMASDPATTLALAEVTAHLCHVLEDTQEYVRPSNISRKARNAQNQSTYLDPYQMTELNNSNSQQHQPPGTTTEDIILNCLGLTDDDNNTTTDADNNNDDYDNRSIPSNVLLNIDEGNETNNDTDHDNISNNTFKERGERVNVQLLKDKILHSGQQQRQRRNKPRVGGVSSALSSAKSSVASESPDLPRFAQKDTPTTGRDLEENTAKKYTPSVNAVTTTSRGISIGGAEQSDDVEDIRHYRIPKLVGDGDNYFNSARLSNKEAAETSTPAVVQFYKSLDNFLVQKRRQNISLQQLQQQVISQSTNTTRGGDLFSKYIPDTPTTKSVDPSRKMLEATIKKWKSGSVQQIRGAKFDQSPRIKFQKLSRLQKGVVLLFALLLGIVFLTVTGFAAYGMYTAWNTFYGTTASRSSSSPFWNTAGVGRRAASQLAPEMNGPPEIVIRVVKEVVHVTNDGSKIYSGPSGESISDSEIQKVAECVQSSFAGK